MNLYKVEVEQIDEQGGAQGATFEVEANSEGEAVEAAQALALEGGLDDADMKDIRMLAKDV